jgi:hypothetical protein
VRSNKLLLSLRILCGIAIGVSPLLVAVLGSCHISREFVYLVLLHLAARFHVRAYRRTENERQVSLPCPSLGGCEGLRFSADKGIEQLYKKVGNFWLPARNLSISSVRLGGGAGLTIEYTFYKTTSVDGD